jgi:uncharacterized protein YegL
MNNSDMKEGRPTEIQNFKQEFDDIMGDLVEECNNVTYVCFIMDHSGSMGWNQKQSLSNFNEYLATVKKEAEDDMQTVVTVIEFDNTIKVAVDNQLVEDVEMLTEYWIGGATALYDAIGTGINTIRKLMDHDPRENKAAIFFINTDGYENASTEFSQENLKNIMQDLEDSGKWTFTFLAEGLDVEEANQITGVLTAQAAGNTVSFAKSAAGYQQSLTSNVKGIQAYYSARKMGDTQVFNFHQTGDTHDDGGEEGNVNRT